MPSIFLAFLFFFNCFLCFFLSQRLRVFFFYHCYFKLVSLQTKDARKILSPWDISTAISPMTGISAKRVQVIVEASRKLKIKTETPNTGRITKTTQNQLSPNQWGQMTRNETPRYTGWLPVRASGWCSSSKCISLWGRDPRKLHKTILSYRQKDWQKGETIRLEDLCDRGAQIIQILI